MTGRFIRLHDATAGPIAEVDADWFASESSKDKFVVTAVRNAAKDFKVIYWRITEKGEVVRDCDSGTSGGKADLVRVVSMKAGGSMTASRDASTGNLRLTNWRPTGSQVKKFVSVDAGAVKGIALANLGVVKEDFAAIKYTSMLITGVATENGNLKVIAWVYTNPGLSANPNQSDQGFLHRLGSGEAGKVSLLSIARLGGWFGQVQKFVTSLRDESGNLRNIVWHASETEDKIERVGTASAGEIWDLDVIGQPAFPSTLYTAVADSGNELKIIKWAHDLTRLGDVTIKGKTSKISVAINGHKTIFVAEQAGLPNGNLRLVAFEIDAAASAPIHHAATMDAGELGGMVKLLYMEDNVLVTAFRNSAGNLQLTSWRYEA